MHSKFFLFPPNRPRHSAETALTGDATLLLIIATTIVLVCGWVAWRSYVSDEDQAQPW